LVEQHNERRVVVSYDPGQRRRQRVLVGLLLIALLVIAYFAGTWHARAQLVELQSSLALQGEENASLKEKVAELKQRIAMVEVSAAVDSESVKEVYGMVQGLEQTIADQREELAFYKGMMAPEDIEKGLSVRSWQIQPSAVSNRYHFRLVVQQLADVHLFLKGQVSIELAGEQGGEVMRYAISELSPQIDKNPVRLGFKYFQNIEGELELPEGFVPLHVEVVALAKGRKTMRVERSFAWQQEDMKGEMN
jgi:cell division protein FtsB